MQYKIIFKTLLAIYQPSKVILLLSGSDILQPFISFFWWGGGVPGHAHNKKTFHDTLKQELCTVQLNNIIIST